MSNETAVRHVGNLTWQHIVPLLSAVRVWHIKAPFGTEPEDFLDPAYFRHVASRGQEMNGRFTGDIRQGDFFVVRGEGFTWTAIFEVAVSTKTDIKCRKLAEFRDEQVAENVHGYEVKFIPSVQWTIRRISDREIIEKNLQTKGEAVARMRALFGPAQAAA